MQGYSSMTKNSSVAPRSLAELFGMMFGSYLNIILLPIFTESYFLSVLRIMVAEMPSLCWFGFPLRINW